MRYRQSKLNLMKKVFLLAFTFSLFTLACGDAGIESDISKLVEIDPLTVSLTVPNIAIGQRIPVTPPIIINTDEINFGDSDFEDYDLGEIESYAVNEMFYSIEGFEPGLGTSANEADLQVDMNIVFEGGDPEFLLSTTISDIQNNVDNILLFDKSNPGSVRIEVIQNLERSLLNGRSFALQLVMEGRDVLLQSTNQDFDIAFKFDVTVRVQLNN